MTAPYLDHPLERVATITQPDGTVLRGCTVTAWGDDWADTVERGRVDSRFLDFLDQPVVFTVVAP